MKAPIQVALYVRTNPHTEINNRFSIIDRLKQSCLEMGKNVVQIYHDEGFSGNTLDRPALKQMLLDAREGHFNEIVVAKVSQLARNSKVFFSVVEQMTETNTGIIATDDNFETSSATGKFIFKMMAASFKFSQQLEQCEGVDGHV